MSEQELNKYRLTSMEEPTDEILSLIMKEVAAEVRAENEKVNKQLIQTLRDGVAKQKLEEQNARHS